MSDTITVVFRDLGVGADGIATHTRENFEQVTCWRITDGVLHIKGSQGDRLVPMECVRYVIIPKEEGAS